MEGNPAIQEQIRYDHDISHSSNMVGIMGHLQTLTFIPVVAGDSLSIDATALLRLSNLKRYMYLDAHWRVDGFFIPYRQIYPISESPNSWIEFIKDGFDEGVTLGSQTLPGALRIGCHGYRTKLGETLPNWFTKGPIKTWNEYYRDPADTSGTISETFWTTASPTDYRADVGYACARLKTLWTTTFPESMTTPDYRLALDGGEVDLRNFAAKQGTLKSEIDREYQSKRYRDLMKNSFGGEVSNESEPYPYHCFSNQGWLGGHDIEATDGPSLGTFAGRSAGQITFGMPMRFFPEHGTFWIHILVRFLPVAHNARHFLMSKANPTYQEIAGDPEVIGRISPYSININEIFTDVSSVAIGNQAYAFWYRWQDHVVHQDFQTIAGHPYIDGNFADRNASVYHTQTEYDSVFASTQLRHWNCHAWLNIIRRSIVPGPMTSIYAGTGEFGSQN